jgi:4-amino-4-deoxy-L-arabinose transferase-like glycosyltransferase
VRAPRDVLLLTALAGSLLLVGLGAVALTDRDEGANAEAAREMLEQSSWITPTLGGAPRFAKPALVYWLTAGAYTVLGVGETAARLPSAVAALLLVLVQYAFARWACGREVGWRAALALLLSVEYVAIGRMALTDATLALWTTLAAYAFLRGWWGPPPRGRWYALGWVAAGLAALTKGPVGFLLPLAGVLGYLGIAGGLRQAWREAWPLRGLALLLLVALPWYVAMFWLHGWDYAARARGETLGRVLRPVTGPGGTALFYLPVLLVGFFPWSAFLPEAVRAGLHQARVRARQSPREAVSAFAAAWLVAGLVLFSLVQTRLPHYVLPLFPPAALLVATSWPAHPSRLSRILLAGTGIALGAVLAGAWLASGQVVRLLAPAYPAAAGATLPASALVVAALTAGAGGGALVRDGQRLFRMLAVLATVVLAIGFQTTLPAFSAEFVAPAGLLAARAARTARACDTLAAVGPYRPSLLFYARRPVTFISGRNSGDRRDDARLAELAARPGRLFVIVPAALVRALPAVVGTLPVVETRGGYVLLASDAAATGCAA